MTGNIDKTIEELLNDIDGVRTVDVKYLGKPRTFEYSILGSEQAVLQKKFLKDINDTNQAIEFSREKAWAMMKKANPSVYTDDLKIRFPTDLLDIVAGAMMDNEEERVEDFIEASDAEAQGTSL